MSWLAGRRRIDFWRGRPVTRKHKIAFRKAWDARFQAGEVSRVAGEQAQRWSGALELLAEAEQVSQLDRADGVGRRAAANGRLQ